jgi:putative tryptophan/tyrosine transport system substrate-binding protein
MRRREFIGLVGGAAAVWPLAARAQIPKVRRIGYVVTSTAAQETSRREAFLKAMQDLGYLEGKNIVVEWRFAERNVERLTAFADELVRLKVDAVVVGTAGIAEIFCKATTEIPIVVLSAGSFEGTGLIQSLNKPGGNVTGVQMLSPELMTKRLGMLAQIVSKLQRVGFIEPITPAGSRASPYLEITRAAAKALEIELRHSEVKSVGEFKTAFADLAQAQFQAALVQANPLSTDNTAEVVAAANESRIPTMYELRRFVEVGGLISYGPDREAFPRLVAGILDEILKGTSPALIPIRQATKFDLVINLKTAKSLELEMPPTLLALANDVIE